MDHEARERLGDEAAAPAACLHGGAFFEAIGSEFDHLERRADVINADVLDAWFPPSPRAVAALQEHLPWLLRTSPPTGSEGLIRTLARVRGVAPEAVLPGGGSSELIFLALRQWLSPSSHALILDPTYGEYAHVLERVVGCRVDRLPLSRPEGYALDLGLLQSALERAYDLVVVVNPNSPTGRHVPRAVLEAVLERAPAETRFWIDETYVEFVGPGESLEQFAAGRGNVVVCKSMSKAYALSGVRVGYLCAAPALLDELRRLTPPWAVGLLGQVAAVEALRDSSYYADRYAETAVLRGALAQNLAALGMEAIPSAANFILSHLPADGPPARTVVERCREHQLYLRDAGSISPRLGAHAVRVAVKDAETNERIVQILARVLRGSD